MNYRSVNVFFTCLFIFLLCGLACPIRGQTQSAVTQYPRTHRFAYTAVVSVPGASLSDLGIRAREWARQVMPVGQLPILTNGTDSEIVRTTGVCPFTYDLSGKTILAELRYNATISVRMGSYQYEVKEFVFVEPGVGRYQASTTPVESYYNGNFRPYTETASRLQMTMRTCFTEIVNEELSRLQVTMRRPNRAAGSK